MASNLEIDCASIANYFKAMKENPEYTEIVQIGQGAFGRVYKAKTRDNKVVAVKHIKFDNEEQGIPSTALREISLLKSLSSHVNIVPLLQVQYRATEKNLKMVFEFYDYDLKKYLQSREGKLSQHQVKPILYQILKGLSFCHSKKVLHRDLKPQNILIDNQGNVKLADFGLGRVLTIPNKTLTHQIQTLWYRAPQILLGQKSYTYAVDMWAVGCIFAQLFTKKPFFQGNGFQIEQIFTIFEMMGTPNTTYWPNLTNLPDYKPTFPKWTKRSTQYILPDMSEKGHKLLSKMLQLNPDCRITATEALQDEYFRNLVSL